MRGTKLCLSKEENRWKKKFSRSAGSTKRFPAIWRSFREQEGAVVRIHVVPSSCCLAAKKDILQSKKNCNRILGGHQAGCFAPCTEIPFGVSLEITVYCVAGRLHQDKIGNRNTGGTQTLFCRTAELAFATNSCGAQDHVMICRAACFAQTDNKIMVLASFFPTYKRISSLRFFR